jgi:hypothetical protein
MGLSMPCDVLHRTHLEAEPHVVAGQEGMPLEADEQVDMLITIVNEWSDSVIQVSSQ